MMNSNSKIVKSIVSGALCLALAFTALTGCSAQQASQSGESETEAVTEAQLKADNKAAVAELSEDYKTIDLKSSKNEDDTYSHTATIDGEEIEEYDYTWHCDPAGTYDECDDAPAEYYTGTEPEDAGIYVAHDIFYYPQIDSSKFEKVNYDGETEWVTYYQSDEYSDYIFGTLPVKGQNVPEEMMHSAEEAYSNAVLHINEAGTYKLTGDWHGQVYVDLGDDADENPEAVVTLILDNADIECTVAPGVIFKSVYECDNEWEDRDEYDSNVDTSAAGANIIIADGSENSISGTNIFRMLKTKYKDDDSLDAVPVQKKIRKNDGALYSYMSMNIYGEDEDTGILNVTSENEGIDSELHLTINGGTINIYSQDDGINTNEDGVSVTTVNGGDIRIVAGLGNEGDGIDSNGFLVINGGKVISLANPASDSGLDSDCGSYINGGEVLALGSTMDWAENDDSDDSSAVTMNLQFAQTENANEKIEIMDNDGNIVFSYCQADDNRVSDYQRFFKGAIISCEGLKVGESYTVWIGGKQQAYSGNNIGMGHGGMPPQMPDGQQPPQMEDGQQLPQMAEGQQPPQMAEGETPPERPDTDDQQGMNDGQPPQMPDGQQAPQMGDSQQRSQIGDGSQPPQMAEGETPPEKPDGDASDGMQVGQLSEKNGGQPPQMQNGQQSSEMQDGQMPSQMPSQMPGQEMSASDTAPIAEFRMEDKVNNFSGVSDY